MNIFHYLAALTITQTTTPGKKDAGSFSDERQPTNFTREIVLLLFTIHCVGMGMVISNKVFTIESVLYTQSAVTIHTRPFRKRAVI